MALMSLKRKASAGFGGLCTGGGGPRPFGWREPLSREPGGAEWIAHWLTIHAIPRDWRWGPSPAEYVGELPSLST